MAQWALKRTGLKTTRANILGELRAARCRDLADAAHALATYEWPNHWEAVSRLVAEIDEINQLIEESNNENP
jgi:hypothetical protein